MKTVSLSRGNWAITLPLLGLTALFVGIVYWPGQSKISELRKELTLQQQQSLQSEQLAANIPQTEAELKRVRAYVETWRRRTYGDEGPSALYGTISALIASAGAKTTRLEPGQAVLQHQFSRVPMMVSCLGSFEQIHELLRSLESLPQLVWVDSLRLDHKPEAGQELQCELSLVIFADKPKDFD